MYFGISILERGKFYPKKVIQIGGVKLSTQISHAKIFIQKSYYGKYDKVRIVSIG